MMLQIMVYTVAVATALSLVGLCIERIAGLYRLPRRAAWIAAMLLSVLFPVAMISGSPPEATHGHSAGFLELAGAGVIPDSSGGARVTLPVGKQRGAWIRPPSDRQLIAIWAVSSSSIILYLCGASFMLRRQVSGWQRKCMLGQDVLVSEVTGPALMGVLAPRIVVPRWLVAQPAATQALILEHEQQHLKASDPFLMVIGLFIIAAVPWNLPLWWQWRRMRQAVEMDCDARVLRAGADATTYAEVLLAVTRRATRMPAGALAMSEPVAPLERRIESLVPGKVRHVIWKTLIVLALAALGVGIAMVLRAPTLPSVASGTLIQPQVAVVPESVVPLLAPVPAPAVAANVVVAPAVQPDPRNADNRLDRSEPITIVDDPRLAGLVAEARTMVPREVLQAKAGKIIADNDQNSDGIVTRQEAAATNKALTFQWNLYDKNRDGMVTAAEVARFTDALEIGTAVEKLGGDPIAAGLARKPTPTEIIAVNDQDGDGIVTREEATKARRATISMWHLFDLNKDDRLDAAEVAMATGY